MVQILGPVDTLECRSILRLIDSVLTLIGMYASNLTELCVADHTIAVVVTSSEDGLDVLSPWEVVVLFQEVAQV